MRLAEAYRMEQVVYFENPFIIPRQYNENCYLSNLNWFLQKVLNEFEIHRIILESDSKLPSISSIVSGKPVIGSWWAVPKSNIIWKVLNKFYDRKDVLTTKLVSGKVTFLHKSLWSDFLAVATSREGWQTSSLLKGSITLLKLIDKKGTVRTDELFSTQDKKFSKEISIASLELERKLLIHQEQIHTESGYHARILSSWTVWSKQAKFSLDRLPKTEDAKLELERRVKILNKKFGAGGRLPWQVTMRENSVNRKIDFMVRGYGEL